MTKTLALGLMLTAAGCRRPVAPVAAVPAPPMRARAAAVVSTATPDVSAWFRTPDRSDPSYRWLHIEKPLRLWVDAKGDPHLSVEAGTTGGPCTVDTTGNVMCSSLSIPPMPPQVFTAVTGEAPVHSTALATEWTLKHIPDQASVVCTLNGLRQADGIDYTVHGDRLSTGFWTDADTIRCDYKY